MLTFIYLLATSTAVKWVFSQGQQLLYSTQNQLLPSTIHAFLCLGACARYDLLHMEDLLAVVKTQKRKQNEIEIVKDKKMHEYSDIIPLMPTVKSQNSAKSNPNLGLPQTTWFTLVPQLWSCLGLFGPPLVPWLWSHLGSLRPFSHSDYMTLYGLFHLDSIISFPLSLTYPTCIRIALRIQCLHHSDLQVLPPIYLPWILYLTTTWTSTFPEHAALGLQPLPCNCTI